MIARSSSSWIGTLLLLAACTERPINDEHESSETGETDTETDCPSCEHLLPAAGFVELPAVDYQLGPDTYSTTPARQFWAMQPAEVAPEQAPVFVFFNGGPGSSTGFLLGFNTGPMSFDPALTGPDEALVPNPDSWTRLGTLIWIDARQTGFSYGLLDDPSDEAARSAAIGVANFNTYRDAADFVITLLRLLADYPTLQDNPIVLVGESYGGTRAQVMLDMLLHPAAYGDGSRPLQDPELVALIEAHHQAVHGLGAGPEQIASQFGRQILIQPAIASSQIHQSTGTGLEQLDSAMEQLAAELGVAYMPCAELGASCLEHAKNFVLNHGRSAYDYRAPYSWLGDVSVLVSDRLNDSATSEALLGVAASEIFGLAASERTGAWRVIDPDSYPSDASLGDWPAVTGALEPWDRYFMDGYDDVYAGYISAAATQLNIHPFDPHFGALFLDNLIYVDTLITEAAYDLVVYTPAIPGALATYASIVSAVEVDPDAQEWLIEYLPEHGVGSRIVTVPRYEASHMVTLHASGQLRDDVEDWLSR